MSYEKLEVGKLFKEGKVRYPEGVQFDINDGGVDLVMYYGSPTSKEKEAIKKGSFKHGYLVRDNVILMFFKFGQQAWIDSPFNIHKAINLTDLPEVGDGTGYGLHIYLVDANTGILKVMRMIGMDTTLSRALRSDVLKQRDMPYDGFDQNLGRLYQKQTDELVKMAKVIID